MARRWISFLVTFAVNLGVFGQNFFPEPVCLTPNGVFGKCLEPSNCTTLPPNNNIFSQTICYTNTFRQGVCCPQSPNLFDVWTPAQPLFPTFPIAPPQFIYPNPSINSIPNSSPPVTNPTGRPTNNQINTNEKFQTELLTTTTENPFLDPRSSCGRSGSISDRIYGGLEATSGQWSWMVAIYIKNYPENVFNCGGTLIGAKYVLTAAHCTSDSDGIIYSPTQLLARMGNLDLSNSQGAHLVPVKEIRKNRNYQQHINDIAILVLKDAVQKSPTISPICLPDESFDRQKYQNSLSLVAGWGATSESESESKMLKYAAVPIWKNSECHKVYLNSSIRGVTDAMICAGFRIGGVDTCQGDSGGPLMVDVNSRWTQIGISSTGFGCGEPGIPGIYTFVPKFMKWIQDNTRD